MTVNAQETQTPSFDFTDVGESLDRIRIAYRRSLFGYNVGDVLAPNIGIGTEIEGLRPYTDGDDSRSIDWRASGFTNYEDLFTRQFRAEITPPLWIVSDALQTKYEASAGYFSKQQVALTAIMVFAKIAEASGMPTAIALATDTEIVADKEPKGGQHRSLAIGHRIGQLMTEKASMADPAGQPRLADVLAKLDKRARQSSVVVLSGFRDTVSPDDAEHGWISGIHKLIKHGNDLTTVMVNEPHNQQLPKQVSNFWMGGLRFINIAGRHEARIRQRLAELSEQQDEAIQDSLDHKYIGNIDLSTDDPEWIMSLATRLKAMKSARIK